EVVAPEHRDALGPRSSATEWIGPCTPRVSELRCEEARCQQQSAPSAKHVSTSHVLLVAEQLISVTSPPTQYRSVLPWQVPFTPPAAAHGSSQQNAPCTQPSTTQLLFCAEQSSCTISPFSHQRAVLPLHSPSYPSCAHSSVPPGAQQSAPPVKH